MVLENCLLSLFIFVLHKAPHDGWVPPFYIVRNNMFCYLLVTLQSVNKDRVRSCHFSAWCKSTEAQKERKKQQQQKHRKTYWTVTTPRRENKTKQQEQQQQKKATATQQQQKLKNKTPQISLHQAGTWVYSRWSGCWNKGRFVFFSWVGADRKGFMRWKRVKERKWNQAVNLLATIFDLWLSANRMGALWLDVHAHYMLYSPSRHCTYSTMYSASFCPNIFFHLYCIKTLRPIIGERKNTIFLLYNAFHSQLLY